MKKEPVKIAFCTQKGGVGKSTFTVLASSYLHYSCGKNVIVVDCDFPQFSIQSMRTRDVDILNLQEGFKAQAIKQFKDLGKKAYPVIACPSEQVPHKLGEFIESTQEIDHDFILFDLPGTVNSKGVINIISSVDYIFVPIIADRVNIESALTFASTVKDNFLHKSLKGLYLFWNQVDNREKTNLYEEYNTLFDELGFSVLQTSIPDTKRYRKEMTVDRNIIFRSTLFSPSRQLLKGSRLDNLINEIQTIISEQDEQE